MGSSMSDSIRDTGNRLLNRAETVVGDDAREAKGRLNRFATEAKWNYRILTGNVPKSRKRNRSQRSQKSGR